MIIKDFYTNLKFVKSVTTFNILKIVIVSFCESFCMFTSLYYIKKLAEVLSNKSLSPSVQEYYSISYIIYSGFGCIMYFILKSIGAYITEKESFYISENISQRIHDKAITVEFKEFESPVFYNLLQLAKNSGENRPSQYFIHLVDFAKNLLTLCAVSSILYIISTWLPVLLFLFVLPILFSKMLYTKKINKWQVSIAHEERKINYYSDLLTQNQFSKEVKSYTLGPTILNKLIQKTQHRNATKLKFHAKQLLLDIFTSSLTYLGIYGCILFLTLQNLNQKSNPADICLFLIVFTQIIMLLYNVSQDVYRLHQDNIHLNHIGNFLNYDINETFIKESEIQNTISSLEFNEVDFYHNKQVRPTLENITFSLKSGQITAIVGLNGAGKTTLIKILSGLYEITNGTIYLNNSPLNKVDKKTLNQLSAAVFQDFNKYDGTVEELISYGKINSPVDKNQIIACAKLAGAHDFISNLPNGYQTILGTSYNDGIDISIGQWQKISICRCLYSDSKIILLDEATSALDAQSENELFERLKTVIEDKIIVVISHRLSTVKNADHICVLKDGKIVENGTFENLMKEKDNFVDLFFSDSKF